MRILGTKLRMPVSWYYSVIKRQSALFHWREETVWTRPLSCTAFAASPPLAHGTARIQRREKRNYELSLAISKWRR